MSTLQRNAGLQRTAGDLIRVFLGAAHFSGRHARSRSHGGNHEFNQRAGLRIGEPQFSTKFLGSLSHPADANPHAVWLLLYCLLFDSPAIIPHRNDGCPLSLLQTNPDVLCLGMAVHVSQCLLNHSEDCGLQVEWESGKIAGLDIEIGFDTLGWNRQKLNNKLEHGGGPSVPLVNERYRDLVVGPYLIDPLPGIFTN